jgi:hypothetical protein
MQKTNERKKISMERKTSLKVARCDDHYNDHNDDPSVTKNSLQHHFITTMTLNVSWNTKLKTR